MNYILNIHTSTDKAIVNLCHEAKVIDSLTNAEPKQHASFLHIAIQKILHNNDIQVNELIAIGITNGPGSYTGIRVGLATAKGLCFSLKIPLITFSTLEVMAASVIEKINSKDALYCPMIDARRMEVFTAVYDSELNESIPPVAMVLSKESFSGLLHSNSIYFFGNGSKKFLTLVDKSPSPLLIKEEEIDTHTLGKYSWKKFQKREFSDVFFAEPLYIKEFNSAIND